MARRNPLTGRAEGRIVCYPMVRDDGRSTEELREAVLAKLPDWATNPKVERLRETSQGQWWMGIVEVDAPPRRDKEAVDA